MMELIGWALLSGVSFLLFLLSAVWYLRKRNMRTGATALLLLFTLITSTGWTAFLIIERSYHKVTEILGPRTGMEVYDALFGKSGNACIKILDHQDQVVPKIDPAIWLRLVSCPAEMERVLSLETYTTVRTASSRWDAMSLGGGKSERFDPTTLGDTVLVHACCNDDLRNSRTIWTDLELTEVFVRDVLD